MCRKWTKTRRFFVNSFTCSPPDLEWVKIECVLLQEPGSLKQLQFSVGHAQDSTTVWQWIEQHSTHVENRCNTMTLAHWKVSNMSYTGSARNSKPKSACSSDWSWTTLPQIKMCTIVSIKAGQKRIPRIKMPTCGTQMLTRFLEYKCWHVEHECCHVLWPWLHGTRCRTVCSPTTGMAPATVSISMGRYTWEKVMTNSTAWMGRSVNAFPSSTAPKNVQNSICMHVQREAQW